MEVSWQDVAIQWVDLIAGHLRELLTSVLALLRSRLGVDLGLKPELYPSWAVLTVVLLGPLLALCFWAAACSGTFGGKKRSSGISEDGSSESAKASASKAVKTDDQKKRNRKKTAEKKPQPNGHTVSELQEEVKGTEDGLKPTTEVKTEKAKKNKKKPKAEVVQTKSLSTTDGKEPDEGAWETKISNREKRQQRRKDKAASDDSGSPGGTDLSSSMSVEPPRIAPTAPVAQKKNKGEPLRFKAGKGDSIITQVSASWNETPALNGRGWSETAAKVPATMAILDGENWIPLSKAAARRNPEPPAWVQENEGSWSGVDGRGKKADVNPSTLGTLSVTPTGAEPQPATDLDWDSQPEVDDEWSGLNRLGEDPSSDWNAPSVRWGNYEETNTPPEELLPEAVKGSDDEKEKGDSAAAGNGKSKKKKKKKKKQDEMGAGLQDSGEPEREPLIQPILDSPLHAPLVSEPAAPVPLPAPEARVERSVAPAKDSVTPRPSKQAQAPRKPAEPEPTVTQMSPSAHSQKKSEENWESTKQVKKRRARKET